MHRYDLRRCNYKGASVRRFHDSLVPRPETGNEAIPMNAQYTASDMFQAAASDMFQEGTPVVCVNGDFILIGEASPVGSNRLGVQVPGAVM